LEAVSNALADQNIHVTDNEKDADFILRATVCVDGIISKIFRFLFLYQSRILDAQVIMNISLIEAKSRDVIMSSELSGSAKYKQEYILGIGPIGEDIID